MSAQDHLQPHQFDQVRQTQTGATIASLHESRYSREPEYMAALEADVKKNGFRNPVRVSPDADGSISLLDGSHRAAVAYHLGIPLPVSNGDNENTRNTSLWHKKLRQISGKPQSGEQG